MEFNSAIFLFCFLPVLTILLVIVRNPRASNILLLAAGLIFYSFGQLSGLLLLLTAAFLNYLFGLLLQRCVHAKACCAAAVVLNLLFLAVFNYLDFFLSGIAPLFGSTCTSAGLLAPVGISFFTFKCISYIVDTYRDRKAGTRNFAELLLYISFFPQLMAGPITRFSEFRPQLTARRVDIVGVAKGLRRFTIGLVKKLVFASVMGSAVDAVFALDTAALDCRLAWLGAVAYTMQIYFDFSGYSDMAIGLGEAFGFRTPENFNYPYAAVSITDFWRRWHISLSSWFRDYLYIPLGGSRRGASRTALNKLLVFALCGLWHGAAWTFILWGLWHGIFSALESLKVIDIGKLRQSAPGRALSHVYTMLVVGLGFVMFRAESLSAGLRILGEMFSGFSFQVAGTVALHRIAGTETLVIFLVGALLSIPSSRRAATKLFCRDGVLRPAAQAASYGLSLVLLAWCVLLIASGGFSPFIYFKF